MADKALDPRGDKRCGTCHGTKTVPVKDTAGTTVRQVPCPSCNGKGVGSGMMTK